MPARTLTLSPDPASGRRLGKYEVVSRLGSGGMAEIFLAFTRGAGGSKKLAVLKKVLPDVREDPDAVQMFLDEAKITAGFNHPNIARVFELDQADGDLFLAMEFIPGADLVEIAKACADAGEPIPTGFSLRTVRDCAHALHHAHSFVDARGQPNPVIHRDVAEKNIMVTFDGVTKLVDFGIAKARGRTTRTATGMVKGTTGYMAPEQVRGDPIDARADVFSLGVVLHELLTGQRLFYGDTPATELVAVLEMEAFPPSERNRSVTPQLDAVVLKALTKEREGRYATALDFARALDRAGRGLMWDPARCGELVTRLFSDRREQTRGLLAEANRDDRAQNAPLLRKPPAGLGAQRPAAVAAPVTARPPRRASPPLRVEEERTVLHDAGASRRAVTMEDNPFAEPDATVLKPPEPEPSSGHKPYDRLVSGKEARSPGRVRKGPIAVAIVFALLAILAAIGVGLFLRSQEPPRLREAPPKMEF